MAWELARRQATPGAIGAGDPEGSARHLLKTSHDTYSLSELDRRNLRRRRV